jgi:hypothetical protein
VPHDCNSQQSFAVLPLKPNGQIKTWVHYDQILSDLAISKNESPSGVSGTRHSSHINGDGHPINLPLDARRNPRTAFFI